MQFPRCFSTMKYRHHAGGIDHEPMQRIEAYSHEEAAREISGDGLTLATCPRIRGISYLVAKVWSGSDYRYVYRYPT
jgi:hypothetical protein